MPKKTSQKVPVSARALIQRINRKLQPELMKVKICRQGRWLNELGDHFLVDLNHNAVLRKHVDLEELGKELKVLEPWESLAGDE